MQYSFRTRTEDTELEHILSSLEGKERADFIRSSLYFYIKYGETIQKIKKDIAEIKETLKNQPSTEFKRMVPGLKPLYKSIKRIFFKEVGTTSK